MWRRFLDVGRAGGGCRRGDSKFCGGAVFPLKEGLPSRVSTGFEEVGEWATLAVCLYKSSFDVFHGARDRCVDQSSQVFLRHIAIFRLAQEKSAHALEDSKSVCVFLWGWRRFVAR